jgi:hypothetical protein
LESGQQVTVCAENCSPIVGEKLPPRIVAPTFVGWRKKKAVDPAVKQAALVNKYLNLGIQVKLD